MNVVVVMREPICDEMLDILQNPESGGEHLARSAVVESVREVRRGRWVVLCRFLNNLDGGRGSGSGGGDGGCGGTVGEKQVSDQVDELKHREERRLATRVSSLRSQLLGQVLFSS